MPSSGSPARDGAKAVLQNCSGGCPCITSRAEASAHAQCVRGLAEMLTVTSTMATPAGLTELTGRFCENVRQNSALCDLGGLTERAPSVM